MSKFGNKEIALRICVSEQAVSKWENGVYHI
ncbi:MAG: helix-turn-helix transcriptional regulator [Ruminococcaceae bacterium]|nr:helix-turn-helix transcriptional regulator [Oscillospiraceae bacterium]